jgi:AcrR family transcriptional regulator
MIKMSKRETQKEQRRTEIIEKAKELVLNKGLQDVQLQDVADEVGIGIATFYRYFPNKQLLTLAVNSLVTKQLTDQLEQILKENMSGIEQLEKVLDFYIEVVDEKEHKFLRFVKAFESYRPQSSDSREFLEYVEIRRKYADVLFELAEKGARDGSLKRDIDLHLAIFTFVQNISHFSAETTLTEHDPQLPVKLEAKKQLMLLKDVFLTYVRA